LSLLVTATVGSGRGHLDDLQLLNSHLAVTGSEEDTMTSTRLRLHRVTVFGRLCRWAAIVLLIGGVTAGGRPAEIIGAVLFAAAVGLGHVLDTGWVAIEGGDLWWSRGLGRPVRHAAVEDVVVHVDELDGVSLYAPTGRRLFTGRSNNPTGVVIALDHAGVTIWS